MITTERIYSCWMYGTEWVRSSYYMHVSDLYRNSTLSRLLHAQVHTYIYTRDFQFTFENKNVKTRIENICNDLWIPLWRFNFRNTYMKSYRISCYFCFKSTYCLCASSWWTIRFFCTKSKNISEFFLIQKFMIS